MERIVIVAYKPLPGKADELLELIQGHWKTLDSQGLVSSRKSVVMRAEDETIIEVFGWKSKESMESAHSNPVVQKMWNDYSKVCQYIPVGEVEESTKLFSEFTPI